MPGPGGSVGRLWVVYSGSMSTSHWVGDWGSPYWMWGILAALQQKHYDLPAPGVPGALGMQVSQAWSVQAGLGVAWWVRGVGLYSVEIELRLWSLKYPHLYIN